MRAAVFLFVAIAVGLAEMFVPPILAVALAIRWRAERAARAAGILGFLAGAALFLLAWFVKQLLLIAGLHDLLVDVSTTPKIVVSCLGAGLLAGIVEESIRFGAGAFLFRAARELKPLRAAVIFGLGWGGMEAAMEAMSALYSVINSLQAGVEPPSAFVPFIGLTERTAAIAIHIAFSAFAARAAASRPKIALGIFAATVAAHAALDAGVRAFSLRGFSGVNAIEMETFFGLSALAVFAIATRLSSARAAVPSPSA